MFDFDQVTNRRNTGSMKWDETAENELPMWVADMDFPTAPAIREAIEAHAMHGIFGYATLPAAWNDAYVHWWKTRHQYEIQPDWLVFCTGVIPAISSIIRKLTTPAEKVVVMTPVYNVFFNSILNNGRVVSACPLSYDGTAYQLDMQLLEEKLADPQATMLILCNPHNPVGKIWDVETLREIGALCIRHHVTVVSDEIHCDITIPGKEYTPFAAACPHCPSVTCMAPTKTFNIAGLHTAAVMVPDPVIRHKVWRGINTDEVGEPGAFAVEAVIAAYRHGAPWLDALRTYLYQNRTRVETYIREHIPQIHVLSSEATYLLWLDCAALGDSTYVANQIRKTTGLYLTDGSVYGGDGNHFLRMNIACPASTLEDGLRRLQAGVAALCVSSR